MRLPSHAAIKLLPGVRNRQSALASERAFARGPQRTAREDHLNSIGEKLQAQSGVGPGFDRLRLVLASLVIAVHSVRVVAGPLNGYGHLWLVSEMVVPMFFVLSGFLVTASAHRHAPKRFFINRFLRIYPALAACVLVSALVLGPLLTSLPLREYFTSKDFYKYFLLLAGKAYFALPGVFEHNPDAGMINVSLWTVRWEIGCYALLGLAAASGLLWRRRLSVAIGLAILLLPSVVILSVHLALAFPGTHLAADARQLVAPHDQFFVDTIPYPKPTPGGFAHWFLEVVAGWNFKVVPFFVAGAMAYLMRYRLPYSAPLALASALFLLAAGAMLPESWNGPLVYLLAYAPTVYLVVWAGLTEWPELPLLGRGDYSYGVYLFGFPIQQLVFLTGLDRGLWWLNSLVSLPATLAVAALSWHMIEFPILRRRSAAMRRFESSPAPVPAMLAAG